MKKLLVDLFWGLAIYAVVAGLFGRSFNLFDLGIVVFFAYGPDLDTAIYILLKELSRSRFRPLIPARYRDPFSHWYIHFPYLYILIGTALVWIIGGRDWFYVTMFVLASISHFLHDADSVPGLQWFWPISEVAYAFHGLRFVRVSDEERRAFYEKQKQGASNRSLWEEVVIRTWRRAEWMDRK